MKTDIVGHWLVVVAYAAVLGLLAHLLVLQAGTALTIASSVAN